MDKSWGKNTPQDCGGSTNEVFLKILHCNAFVSLQKLVCSSNDLNRVSSLHEEVRSLF